MRAARVVCRAAGMATARRSMNMPRNLVPRATCDISLGPGRFSAPLLGMRHTRPLHIEVTSGDPKHAADSLRSVLNKEIKHEEASYEGTPGDIDNFLAEGEWEMEDIDGSREVYLKKVVNDEEIDVTFGIMEPDQMVVEEGEEETPLAVPFTVCITRKTGTLTADMMTDDGRCVLQSLTYNKDPEMALGDSADDYEDRMAMYPGPNLHDLDPEVKDMLVQFFSARGIDDNLAGFIERAYYDKEQREYVLWLKSLHQFLA